MAFTMEEYGYVLEGSKPVSIRNFISPDKFPVARDFVYNETEFRNSLLVREAVPIWKRLCSDQKRFILKAVALEKNELQHLSNIEITFINVVKLKEVVEENIDLFRYILGPANTSQHIVNAIVDSDQPLSKILNHDLTLIGIVLGFGAHNSIVGGRLETIFSMSISKDHPPFTPQSYLMQDKSDHSFEALTPERYGFYYLELAGGDDSNFQVDLPRLKPRANFTNLYDEVMALEGLQEAFPTYLWEQPRFVFGAFKGGPANQPVFSRLRKAQKKIRGVLDRPDFLEYVLENIHGKRPEIRFNKKAVITMHYSDDENFWNSVLASALNRFGDRERKLAFLEAFSQPSEENKKPPVMMGASTSALAGLKIAKANLAKADAHFEKLSQDKSLKEIVSKRLYFKTLVEGGGKELKSEDRVRVGLVIEDQEGNILFANHDCWVNISQTIPGFAYGMQGMHVQEKREIFVHPVFGYGALTTLPLCTALVLKVSLLDVDAQTSVTMPALEPHDLRWMQQDAYYKTIEESLKQQPYFAGSFFRQMLDMLHASEKYSEIAAFELKKIAN